MSPSIRTLIAPTNTDRPHRAPSSRVTLNQNSAPRRRRCEPDATEPIAGGAACRHPYSQADLHGDRANPAPTTLRNGPSSRRTP